MTEKETRLIWKDLPSGFSDVMYAEAAYYCCTVLYWIFPESGGFGRWAMQRTPILDGKVFATLDEAKAAGDKAFHWFETTKPWSVICDEDAWTDSKLKRHYEPGCKYAREPA